MSIWHSALTALLPQDCLLCGDFSGAALLCAACARELPQLPHARCPVCAEASPGGATCGACLKSPPHFDATVAAFRYAFPLDKLVQALKYRRRLATADFLADAMRAAGAPAGDIVVPLPLSVSPMIQRAVSPAAIGPAPVRLSPGWSAMSVICPGAA